MNNKDIVVDKTKFDRLLAKMLASHPVTNKDLKIGKRKKSVRKMNK